MWNRMKKTLLTSVAALLLATATMHTGHADEDGIFPEELHGIWCIEFNKSKTTKIFLVSCLFHPDYDRKRAAVLIISNTQYLGPGDRYCHLNTIKEVEPEPTYSSAVYVVHGECHQSILPVWPYFKIRITYNEDKNDPAHLIIEPLPEG